MQLSDIGLGSDKLLVTQFSGTEFISDLFSFEISVLSPNTDVAPEQIVGKEVTVTLRGEQERYFHGYIHSFVFGETVDHYLRHYQLTLVPWLWFLSQTNDHRIFQHKNTKEIVSRIFTDLGFHDFTFRAEGGKPREYCIQHNESDLAFVSRLLAEDGISYFFQHEQGKHQLILVDQKYAYKPCPENQLEYSHGSHSKAQISRWRHGHHFRKGVWSLNDYDFKTSKRNLRVRIDTLSKFTNNKNFEHYEYPALYHSSLGQALVKMRIEAEEARRHCVDGESNYATLYAGGLFTLEKHTSDIETGDYVLTSVTHAASDESYSTGKSGASSYTNQFTCVPEDVHIRPEPIERPLMRGPQTAVVVGPAGEEIYVDEFGRIKVQFIWDREGKMDENSTCFLRVAQTWAGNKWGASFIPRIGHEVIVDFFDGDPDRPYVSGSVYNGQNRPPYTSKTHSGIKTRSTKGGSPDNYNEIRFDDKKGAEQIYVHAEKDMDTRVENNETLTVDNDRTKIIKHDENSTIENDRNKTVNNNQTEYIKNNKTIDVGSNHKETVIGNMTIHVDKNLQETVTGNYMEDVTKDYGLHAKTITMDADDKITIRTGAAQIVMKSNGDITISGKTINVKGSSDVIIKGSKIKEN